ncbi:unnamed protein product [Peniophora sp. CBMAI 1063]|nr:unnamed protein product [Peniophora sp. CBMAI 1063]
MSTHHHLALAEDAMARLRFNGIIDRLGPRLFERPGGPVDLALIADGMKMEAAIHAAVSGALAIQGIAPRTIQESVASALQDSAYNSSTGAYDILEAEHRAFEGMDDWCTIPVSSSAPTSLSEIAEFTNTIGIGDVPLDHWWENDDAITIEGETTQAGIAAHCLFTVEVKYEAFVLNPLWLLIF